jgi:formylglycine-generating enzyme required for sulfatase activity
MAAPMPTPRIFVSHSHHDNAWCRVFVATLRAAGYTCFYDEDSIPGTSAWVDMIERELGRCDVFVLVLTPAAWESHWVHEERKLALANRKTMLVMVHETTPNVEGFIKNYQWVHAEGMDGTAAAQKAQPYLPAVDAPPQAPPIARPAPPPQPTITLLPRLQSLGFAARRFGNVDCIIPPMCPVPAGPFTMGGDKDAYNGGKTGTSQVQLALGAFEIGMYPLTVAEWACGVTARAVPEPQKPSWNDVTWQKHPVVNISWVEVMAYCAWLAQVTGQMWRLPTEAEWERAARGTDGRVYPWGNQWDNTRANTNNGGPGTTTPVGAYVDRGDASPCGAHDMAGNVWEWTSSIWRDNVPYDQIQCEDNSDVSSVRALRGGSWYNNPQVARAASRYRNNPSLRDDSVGARLLLVRAPGS